ncbi:hypothetical protein F5050DRAFT_1773367 [Lentinula boryana]|uniref:Myb/SANT-like domain-containing protein n=1 Tax=Lentinula boryana TaxID=40481 RepID=A0ABQ8Q7X3_9AGAR|nr:hypothetical protein F5050DRAFT_1773367 [Lentinula boryana]
MGRGVSDADWSNPEDTGAVIQFFFKAENRGKLGQGGNPTKAALNECAAYLAKNQEVKKGGPKTAGAIGTRWRKIKSIFEAILAVKQKKFVGASGWNYDDETGFGVTESNIDEWNDFVRTHTIFKPFATKGWEFFDEVQEILPATIRGKYVYNASGHSSSTPDLQSQSAHSQQSQTDTPHDPLDSATNAIQTNENPSTISHPPTPTSSSGPAASTPHPSLVTTPAPSTPAPSTSRSALMKRPASDVDEFESPWGAKRGKYTGPEAIFSLSQSVQSVGNAIRDSMPVPKKSSAMSPTKKIEMACALLREDRRNFIITWDQSMELIIIFGQSSTAAGVYMSGQDDERGDLAKLLISKHGQSLFPM